MSGTYEEFQELIKDVISEGMSREAKLILLGRVTEATIRRDITPQQADQLEALLGGVEEFRADLDLALTGSR